MKRRVSSAANGQGGFTLIEALMAILILSFGLLGLAGLQTKLQVLETESYQRAQATLLTQDMANRMSANRINANTYLTTGLTPSYLGTGDQEPSDCSTVSTPTVANLDLCEWSHAIKGATEKHGSTSVGAMMNSRGCVELVNANPAVYRISVAWQGMTPISTPALTCGQGLYGNDDSYRRVISSFVSIPNLNAP